LRVFPILRTCLSSHHSTSTRFSTKSFLRYTISLRASFYRTKT
jgi:hypothetical protein